MSRALGSAPAFKRAATTEGLLLDEAAQCKGVAPFLYRALGSAPALSKADATAGFSLKAASCRGVMPYFSLNLGSVTALSKTEATGGFAPIAKSSGIAPFLFFAFGSDPRPWV